MMVKYQVNINSVSIKTSEQHELKELKQVEALKKE